MENHRLLIYNEESTASGGIPDTPITAKFTPKGPLFSPVSSSSSASSSFCRNDGTQDFNMIRITAEQQVDFYIYQYGYQYSISVELVISIIYYIYITLTKLKVYYY